MTAVTTLGNIMEFVVIRVALASVDNPVKPSLTIMRLVVQRLGVP